MLGIDAISSRAISNVNTPSTAVIGRGYSEINFGTGNTTASVFVDDPSITSTQTVEAFLMYDSTADHTASDHAWTACFISLTCSPPVHNTGFTINAISTQNLTGKFSVRYVWA